MLHAWLVIHVRQHRTACRLTFPGSLYILCTSLIKHLFHERHHTEQTSPVQRRSIGSCSGLWHWSGPAGEPPAPGTEHSAALLDIRGSGEMGLTRSAALWCVWGQPGLDIGSWLGLPCTTERRTRGRRRVENRLPVDSIHNSTIQATTEKGTAGFSETRRVGSDSDKFVPISRNPLRPSLLTGCR